MLVIKFKTMLVRKSECSYRLRFQLNFSFLPGLSWATLSDICHGNSMCCWSVTAIVKRINIFTRLLLQSQYKTLHPKCREEIQFPIRASLSLSPAPAGCWRPGTNCNLKGKLNYHQTMSIRRENMILQFYWWSLLPQLFNRLQTLIYYFQRIRMPQKILNDSMTVLLWEYDSLAPGCGCITMTVWQTHSMPSSDGAARKLGHPAKLLLKSGHPKTRMLPFTPPFWSRPCIGLLLCSWNVTWPFNCN